jgi:hypothetical protein
MKVHVFAAQAHPNDRATMGIQIDAGPVRGYLGVAEASALALALRDVLALLEEGATGASSTREPGRENSGRWR